MMRNFILSTKPIQILTIKNFSNPESDTKKKVRSFTNKKLAPIRISFLISINFNIVLFHARTSFHFFCCAAQSFFFTFSAAIIKHSTLSNYL